jgi:hypothetical protein
VAAARAAGAMTKCSFLKKRTKKLLPRACGADRSCLDPGLGATHKSFLVLFFKKELFFP